MALGYRKGRLKFLYGDSHLDRPRGRVAKLESGAGGLQADVALGDGARLGSV
jgi:hypothetical protein